MNLSVQAGDWGQIAGPQWKPAHPVLCFRGVPRGPKVRAGGPAEPSVAPKYPWHVMLAGRPWAGGLSVAAAALYRVCLCKKSSR